MTTGGPVAGLDLDALSAWFADHGLSDGPLSASLIEGGKSNLTYSVTDGASSWVVRRPPLGHVLETAHDMTREHRVIGALAGTAVPVPNIYGLCVDASIIGSPFYVMELCQGVAHSDRQSLELLGPAVTRRMSAQLVDVLAALHGVDVAAVGLSDFGRAGGFLERQVHRWKKQFDGSASRALPAADELFRLLSTTVPGDSATRIIHGDYRMDNVLFHEGRASAVLDWEMSTLGDPLTDLALMITYDRLARMRLHGLSDASAAPGFLDESEVVSRYVEATGSEVAQLPFYLGLAAYKLAAILEGIHFRYLGGQTVGDGFDTIGDAVPTILDVGLSALKEDL